MNQLPEWFWSDRLVPVNYYGYESSVREKFYQIDVQDLEAGPHLERFNDLKRKCLGMEVNGENDVWDNRIVIECKTERGNTIYVGFYDNQREIGLAIDTKREPKAYS